MLFTMIETFKEPADRLNHIEGSKSRQGYQLYSAGHWRRAAFIATARHLCSRQNFRRLRH